MQFLNKVEEDDSVIVKVLKKQGAIPFVKTNVPQSMIKYSDSLCKSLIYSLYQCEDHSAEEKLEKWRLFN